MSAAKKAFAFAFAFVLDFAWKRNYRKNVALSAV
jgi:hypothetical protein